MISIINADNPARAKRALRYLTTIEQTNRTIRYPTISGAHETNDTISNDNLLTRDYLYEKTTSKTMHVCKHWWTHEGVDCSGPSTVWHGVVAWRGLRFCCICGLSVENPMLSVALWRCGVAWFSLVSWRSWCGGV